MAKRFTETKIWDDIWYQELPIQWKLIWMYLCAKCDEAGIWKINKPLVEFQLKTKIKWAEAEKYINNGKQRVEFCADFWVIKDFVLFQYGEKVFTSEHPFHKKIRGMLDRVSNRVSNTLQEEVMVKEEEKVMVKEEVITKWVFLERKDFTEVWEHFLVMRKSKKKPATVKAQDLILAKLHNFGVEIAKEMLNQSIINSWTDVYPLKNQDNHLTKQQKENLQGLDNLIKGVNNDSTIFPKGICHTDSGVSRG